MTFVKHTLTIAELAEYNNIYCCNMKKQVLKVRGWVNRTEQGPAGQRKNGWALEKREKMTGWGSTTKSIIPIFNSKLIQIELEKKKQRSRLIWCQ